MAGSQHNDGYPYDPILEESFSFNAHYSGASPRQEQGHPSETALASSGCQAASTNGGFGPLEGLSQFTKMGTELPQQRGQLLETNSSLDELQEVDCELEQIELQLRRNELRKRRRVLLRKSPLSQQ